MFGLGFGEVLLILAVALIVVGPKKLPEVARLVGRAMAEFRRHADDIQRTIQRELHAPLEAEDVLKKAAGPAQAYPGPPPESAPKNVSPEDRAPPAPPAEPTA